MIEVAKLLNPVSPQNPAGESLRYSPTYDQIKAARREDDAELPQGIWQSKLKKADWQEVRNLCLQALETQSKDLQIAAWLLEACIHIDGFAGAAEGLRVLTALCEKFWSTIYPPLDPDDPEHRLAPIAWIDSRLSVRLKLIPVTSPGSGDLPPYTWGDWENAIRLERAGQKDKKAMQAAEAKGSATQSRFVSSATMTPSEFFRELKGQLSSALEEADRFEKALVRLDGTQEGALHQIKDVLRVIFHFVTESLSQRGADAVEETVITENPPLTDQPETEMATKEQEQDLNFMGPIRNRAQAYQMLSAVADYLMKTEPHSPTPYLVRRAVAWGGMSLGDLLAQMMRNPSELTELNRLLGLDEMTQKK